MAQYRFSIRIDASPARVFDLFMDLERMREWVGGVTRVTDLTGPVDRPGMRYTVWFGHMRSPTQILEVERPRHVRTRFGNLILKGESDVTFEPDDGGTRLTQEVRTRGLVSAVVARVFATGSYKGSFCGELNAFREIAERKDVISDEGMSAPDSRDTVAGMTTPTIRPCYDMWPQYNRRLREVICTMSDEELAIRPSAERWPIWATVGHTAGARVYWLCDVLGEAGAETTPFTDAATAGWEDDLDHPRGADELVAALDSTWRLVEGCLDRWTLDMLADEFHRDSFGEHQVHTRGSVLQRLFTHDAYHCGELSQTLGIHGLPQIDLWGYE